MEISNPNWSALFRQATDADQHLETYDHTKLSAMNVCPTWGTLRYEMHKRVHSDSRAMALEAGTAMHEVFAWVRLCSLVNQLNDQGKSLAFTDQVWRYHGTRLFGHERNEAIREAVRTATDVGDVATRGAIVVLDTSGFYDDPRDKRRTLSNLEECAYAYINRWRWDHPVWIRTDGDPTSDVGIELSFDIVVSFTDIVFKPFRLTGRVDGIHYDLLNRLVACDNKTASRLSDAWEQSQAMSHQFTGYTVAATVFTQQPVSLVEVLGLAIPMPRAYDYGGYARETFPRHLHHYKQWLQWLIHTVEMTRIWSGNPYDAPKYTHSCSRYFRPCQFIPFCFGDDEEKHRIVEELETHEWSPLDKPILDGVGDE